MKQTTKWDVGSWAAGTALFFVLFSLGVGFPWGNIAQCIVYLIGAIKSGRLEKWHPLDSLFSVLDWILRNARNISIALLIFMSAPYIINLPNAQVVTQVNYDRVLEYSGQLASVEYIMNSWFGLAISDTRLTFQDGKTFTVIGQHDYLLNATYTVFWREYSANKTAMLSAAFLFPTLILPTRPVYESKVLNITFAEMERFEG